MALGYLSGGGLTQSPLEPIDAHAGTPPDGSNSGARVGNGVS